MPVRSHAIAPCGRARKARPAATATLPTSTAGPNAASASARVEGKIAANGTSAPSEPSAIQAAARRSSAVSCVRASLHVGTPATTSTSSTNPACARTTPAGPSTPASAVIARATTVPSWRNHSRSLSPGRHSQISPSIRGTRSTHASAKCSGCPTGST